jgi:D-glycero-D-manno-heptose 1,7-bisphosphate phosphatase
MNKALFLDRDGVINVRLVGAYVRTPSEFTLIDEILPLLREARTRGYKLIVISNHLDAVHTHMQKMLRASGSPTIDAIYSCTDLDNAQSTHRKPAPGMLFDAMREHDVDPSMSWFVGDSRTDAQAGAAAGVHTALIGTFEPSDAEIIVQTHAALFDQLVPRL